MRNFRSTRFFKQVGMCLPMLVLLTNCAKQEAILPSTVVSATPVYSDEQLVKGVFLFQGDIPSKLSLFQPYLAVIKKAEATNPKLASLRAQQADKVYNAIVGLDPNFPREFRNAIVARNFTDVQAMLQKGGLLIASASLLDDSHQSKHQRATELAKSMDLTKYDFKSEEGLRAFVIDAKKTKSLSLQSSNMLDMPEDPCLEFDIAVAVEAWEFVVLVNDVAAVTNVAVAFALEWAWGISDNPSISSAKAGVVTNGSVAVSAKDNMEKELFVKEITMNLM